MRWHETQRRSEQFRKGGAAGRGERHQPARRLTRGRTRRSSRPNRSSPRVGTNRCTGRRYDQSSAGRAPTHSYTLVLGEELGRIDCAGVPMASRGAGRDGHAGVGRWNSGAEGLPRARDARRGWWRRSGYPSRTRRLRTSPVSRTKAVRDGDDWAITGRKMWITNGTQADWICLLARTSDEAVTRGCRRSSCRRRHAGVQASGARSEDG
ncbi:MAG: acyl-CoA dehydrogenase [Candidatus Nanopelagicales bacterium]